MRVRRAAWLLAVWSLLAGTAPAREDETVADERLVRSAKVGVDGPALLVFLRCRSAAPDPARVERLLRQLATPQGDEAFGELVARGPAVLPKLKEALNDPALARTKPRIEACLKWLEGPEALLLSQAVVRLVARRQPKGAVPALLALVPSAEEALIAEVRDALAALALRDGKPDPQLLDAIAKDADAGRATVAAEALAKAVSVDGLWVRPLLRSPQPQVRRRLAVALAELGESEAVPVLLSLLSSSSRAEAEEALGVLRRLAGPLGPPVEQKGHHAWAKWWRQMDAETLLNYFRKKTPRVPADKAAELVSKLGSKSFRVRQKAEEDLVNLRGLAVPLLEKALVSGDLETRKRAERCLEMIRTAPDGPQSAARARLLALRKPPEAAAVLLAYVAFAEDDAVAEEARRTLTILARRDAKARTTLTAALADGVPQRRAVAVEALADLRQPAYLPALRKLLRDPEVSVRYRVALCLVPRGEKPAVPVLIDTLDQVSDAQVWQADDFLRRLAGDKGPEAALGASGATRRKYRDAWAAWWKDNGATVDLARLHAGEGLLGYTLVSQWNGSNTNEIVELGHDNKERWKIDGLGYAFDFVVLPGSRLLLAEHNKGLVTERDFKGQVLWEYKIPAPINCQRLPGGLTFIAASSRVVVVDRRGTALVDVQRYSIMAGQRLRDGRMILMTSGGELIRLDAAGKELGKKKICPNMNNYGGLQVLPNGHFLLTRYDRNKVSEYDLDGKLIWEKDAPSPNFATRLPNGNTLVGSQNDKCLLELDRSGKKVWEYRPGKSIWQSRRR
jgi:HEAT repeat protein